MQNARKIDTARPPSVVATLSSRARIFPPHNFLAASHLTYGTTLELWLAMGYLGVVGIGDLRAEKLGFQLGPVPFFLTDITLALLLVFSFLRWPSRILYWSSTGTGAGPLGRAIWMLCILAAVYFIFSFSRYPLYATRDLALFVYSLYFPVIYFAIRSRQDAVKLLRCLMYAGAVSAFLLLLQEVTGLGIGLFEPSERLALGHKIIQLRNGDANIFAVFSLASLLAYVLLERRLRVCHAICAIVCLFALASAAARSGAIAVLLAATATFCGVRARLRPRLLLLAAAIALPVVVAQAIPANIPGAKPLRAFRVSVLSAAGGPSVDPDAEFRLVRWGYAYRVWAAHPLFGEGFGRAIVPEGLLDRGERKGRFNAGMPHNSFLSILARTGLVGFSLVAYSWISTLMRLLAAVRRAHRAVDLAAANLLAAMLGYATFGLFFERPGTNAIFWILTAVAARLLET